MKKGGKEKGGRERPFECWKRRRERRAKQLLAVNEDGFSPFQRILHPFTCYSDLQVYRHALP